MTRYASVLDLDLASAELDLHFAFGAQRPAAQRLEYWAGFQTNLPEERVREMMVWAEKGCHTTNTIRAAVPIIPRLSLNGAEIAYTPEDAPTASVPLPAEPTEAFGVDASVRIIDTYWREGTSEGFSMNADETAARGGTSRAPSPLEHFLMGIGFGIGNQAWRSAQALGFQLDHFEIDVETAYDARGKLMLEESYVGQLWFKYWLKLQSPEPPARALHLVDHVHRHARTLDSVRRPVELVPHVLVNGREIAYQLPSQPSAEAVRARWGVDVGEAAFWYSYPAAPPPIGERAK